MTGKELLNRHRSLVLKIERQKVKIQRLEERKTSLSFVNDGMPKGSDSYTMEDYMADKEELEAALLVLTREQSYYYDQIFGRLPRMQSSKEIDILWQRYLFGKSWAVAERDMKISHSYAMALHRSALVNFEKTVYST